MSLFRPFCNPSIPLLSPFRASLSFNCQHSLTSVAKLPSRAYSITNRFRMAQEYKLSVSPAALKSGRMAEADVEGIKDGKVLLVKADGKINALSAKCTHYGAPLAKGVFDGRSRVTCPWHGGECPSSDHLEKMRIILMNICSVLQHHDRRRRRRPSPRSIGEVRSLREERRAICQSRRVRHNKERKTAFRSLHTLEGTEGRHSGRWLWRSWCHGSAARRRV